MGRHSILKAVVVAAAIAPVFGRPEAAPAQTGCFSNRCRAVIPGTNTPTWPMIQVDNAVCPDSHPYNAGLLNFQHGQRFFHITLKSSGSSPLPCFGRSDPTFCNEPGKSGFIYSHIPARDLVTQEEFDTQTTYSCWNGVIGTPTSDQVRIPISDSLGRRYYGDDIRSVPSHFLSVFRRFVISDLNESTRSSRCQNTLADGNDRLIDLNDLGCPPETVNDDSAGAAQCQNAADDDGDGLTDLDDPGCSSTTDNDEGDGTSQCQNSVDDDADGLIDVPDPGCSSPLDNNESDEPTKLSVSAECLFSNPDGSKLAFFSYSNTSGADFEIALGSSGSTQNQFFPPAEPINDLFKFKAGAVLGAIGVPFSGSSIEWRARPSGAALAVATANASTPACETLVPKSVCQGFLADGLLRVRYDYLNPNAFDVTLPIGQSNSFTPGAADRGQPTKFLKGLNSNSIEIPLESPTEAIIWNLTGNSASNASLPPCDGECDEIPLKPVKGQLNEVAVRLANLTKTAAEALKRAAVADARADGNSSEGRRTNRSAENDFVDAERAIVRADEQVRIANQLLLQIPDITVTCPNAPKTCNKVDRIETIDGLRSLYAEARNAVKRIVARTNFRLFHKTVRDDPMVVRALRLERQGLTELAKLPRFAEECSK